MVSLPSLIFQNPTNNPCFSDLSEEPNRTIFSQKLRPREDFMNRLREIRSFKKANQYMGIEH
jgi:hypothetical protein